MAFSQTQRNDRAGDISGLREQIYGEEHPQRTPLLHFFPYH